MAFNNFPYTNFQDLNLDWIMRNVKTALLNSSDAVETANNLKNFVETYFDNLDVQQEINEKIDEMVESGEFLDTFDQLLPEIIEQWLEDNITPTTPVVDASLTISGAAADAKATGDRIRDLEDSTATLNDILEVTHGVNFVNLKKSVQGKLTSDGSTNSSTAYKTTDFIDVSNYAENTLYIGHRSNVGGVTTITVPVYCTYSETKQLIEYNDTWKNNIPITEGVHYVRFSRENSYFDEESANRIGAFMGAVPSVFIDYEEHSEIVNDTVNLISEVHNITGETVIEHSETLNASGEKVFIFNKPIPSGTTLFFINNVSTKSRSFNYRAKLLKENGTTVDYGITYAGTVIKIVPDFDVYGVSTWVNGTEWSFRIVCGDNLNDRMETIEDNIIVVSSNKLTCGSYSGVTPTDDTTRLRLIDGLIEVNSGDIVAYDSRELYISCSLYDSMENPILINYLPWTSGRGNFVIKNQGYLTLAIANGATSASSTWIVPDDYDCDITILKTASSLYNVLESSYNSSIHTFNNWVESAKRYSNLHGDNPTTESFLFFTDPHLCEGSGWEKEFKEMMGEIQQCYNNIPATFCLDGGDWLGNSDSVEDARYKLGLVNGTMKSMFNRHYDLVGNHDTNEQGVSKLTNASIKNLWFRDFQNCYYTFDGQNTKFYCFNTEGEQDTLATNNNYGWNMCKWFASSLTTDNSPHIALAMHIVYVTPELTTINAIAQEILDIAEAYNNRTSITVDGVAYNFSANTGKIEFAIAGHSHADYNSTINSIPVILTTDTRANINLGATFDLVYVDYNAHNIKFVRVGSGNDRTVNI